MARRATPAPIFSSLGQQHHSLPWWSRQLSSNATFQAYRIGGFAAPTVHGVFHSSFFPVPRGSSFSTQKDEPPATIEKPLQALNMTLVRQIKAELMSVDVNSDGRLDADELKQLLRKHKATFTDEEIIEIAALYYAAKAGGSVRFDNFIEAVDEVAASTMKKKDEKGETMFLDNTEEKEQHFRDTQRHPLGIIGKDCVEFIQTGKVFHGHYTDEELNVKLTHTPPKGFRDHLAFHAVKAIRFLFDTATGWRSDNINISNTLNRVIYLETIAAVPGMVAAIVRHFRSLRTMKTDGGMLQMFLEEANNERMHLLTFVRMKDPSYLFRVAVIVGQFGFGSLFTLAYIISPKFCHRFVGYIEEEACSTYTKIIQAIEAAPDGSELAAWKTQHPPKIAAAYWKLGPDGTVLDLIKAVRADEAEHRDVNHLVGGMKEGQINPLYDPQTKLDLMLAKYVKALMTQQDDDEHQKGDGNTSRKS